MKFTVLVECLMVFFICSQILLSISRRKEKLLNISCINTLWLFWPQPRVKTSISGYIKFSNGRGLPGRHNNGFRCMKVKKILALPSGPVGQELWNLHLYSPYPQDVSNKIWKEFAKFKKKKLKNDQLLTQDPQSQTENQLQ